ncbi:hypothetical protein T492DRAFT_839395 [Pavlovales sp. CCMP2436]|nr:hypothetical protein T492DRAFT_839395 [Pavlovales sp. CCMP2436]
MEDRQGQKEPAPILKLLSLAKHTATVSVRPRLAADKSHGRLATDLPPPQPTVHAWLAAAVCEWDGRCGVVSEGTGPLRPVLVSYSSPARPSEGTKPLTPAPASLSSLSSLPEGTGPLRPVPASLLSPTFPASVPASSPGSVSGSVSDSGAGAGAGSLSGAGAGVWEIRLGALNPGTVYTLRVCVGPPREDSEYDLPSDLSSGEGGGGLSGTGAQLGESAEFQFTTLSESTRLGH